ncbi:MAG: Gp37 family protein [Candidatus Binataceae bacterium]
MAAPLDTPWTGETFSPPVPTDIASFARAIVARLTDALGDQVAVEHFPSDPKRYRMVHRVGAVLVRYAGDEFGKVEEVGTIVQERTFEWRLTVMVRDLGWAYGGQPSGPSPGAYQILEAIRAALTGFIMPGATAKMWPVKTVGDHDAEQGAWIFEATFKHKTVALETATATDFPLLNQVTNQVSDGAAHIEDVETPGPETPQP